MLFRELSEQEYDQFARKHYYRHFLNSKDAFVIRKEAGYSCFFVGIEENKEIIAATGIVILPVLKVFKYAYAQRGFLIDFTNRSLLTFFVQALKEYLYIKHIMFLKLDPYVVYQNRDKEGNVIGKMNRNDIILILNDLGFKHLGFPKGFEDTIQCRFMCVLFLKGKTKEDVLRNMSGHCRNSIKKSQRFNVRVRELNENELPLFKRIMDETAMRKQFVDLCMERYQLQKKVYGDNAKFYMAYIHVNEYKDTLQKLLAEEKDNYKEIETILKMNPNSKKYLKKKKVCEDNINQLKDYQKEFHEWKDKYNEIVPISVAYFIYYEDEIIYVSSGSIPYFKKFNGPYAIQWKVLNDALQKGIKTYNFYGTSGDFTKNASDYGVFCFKRGFGAIPVELIGEFDFILRPRWYKLYKILKKK